MGQKSDDIMLENDPPAYLDEDLHSRHSLTSGKRHTTTIEYSDISPKLDHQPHPSQGSSTMSVLLQLSFPIINVIITAVLLGALIYIYTHANGQNLDYTLAGMKIPTIIALLMTITKMFVGGGITYAVSEYKWVTLQREGGKLALLDVYDACTRGVGGIVRVLGALRLDAILVPAIIFQFGLIAIGPASQQILNTQEIDVCEKGGLLSLRNISNTDWSVMFSNLYSSPRANTGMREPYVVEFAIAQAAKGLMPMPVHFCPPSALNCSFQGVSGFYTVAACKESSVQATIVDLDHNNVTTLFDHFGYNRVSSSSWFVASPETPSIYYAGSMKGRTFYDLNNITAPTSRNVTFDPTIRRLYGDQTFVIVTSKNDISSTYVKDMKDLTVQECTLQSHVNRTTIVFKNGTVSQTDYQTTPMVIDYDKLSNSTYWDKEFRTSLHKNYTMLNAYALQLSIMKSLIIHTRPLKDIALDWAMFDTIKLDNSPSQFLHHVLRNIDISTLVALPDFPTLGMPGIQCQRQSRTYALQPSAFYGLVLSFLIPTIWWAWVWISSLFYTNGVSRGNSQVALMVTGLTPACQKQFDDLSHAGSKQIFQKAKQINVWFGETIAHDGRPGHIRFGLQEEIKPIRTRRKSF
ncbi:uncharacterized protein BYT42DRAFT_582607 [Radiomyces spectabilis]|uniref:uncharacterized protein n=1 Tax=Radiomyces spectabilis TaxID=64574 RepID=UPI0022204117|nr:uncharacterized protein BYT42DRAFT_582607 [Radiomyces spectabilis]KAI8370492.1 hypothetical protein BYT42DRAFT_582607 [Radiomyces spectabilis]